MSKKTETKDRQPKRSNSELAIEKVNRAGKQILKQIENMKKASKNVKRSGDIEIQEAFNKTVRFFAQEFEDMKITSMEVETEIEKPEFDMMAIVEVD